MSRARTWYAVALVVAVVVLVGSIAAAAVWASNGPAARADRQVTDGRGPGVGPWSGGFGERRQGQVPGGTGTGEMGPGGMRPGGQGSGQLPGDSGTSITASQARGLAQSWVDAHLAGATLDGGTAMMGGYRFTATQHGTVAAVIRVAADGTVSARLLAGATPATTS